MKKTFITILWLFTALFSIAQPKTIQERLGYPKETSC
jgi:hypothetical protein